MMKNELTYDEALAWARTALAAHRCAGADAPREASALLAFAASVTPEALILRGRTALPRAAHARLRRAVMARLDHLPLARILGHAVCLGRDFIVTKDTLIPRPATELVLEAAFAAANDADLVVDVGTGSGCIAVSAALALPDASVVAVDISPAALRVARRNARRLAPGRVTFRLGDLLAPVMRDLVRAERPLIVANLPYIPDADYARLSPDIRRHEPRKALVSGRDGLFAYTRLLRSLPTGACPTLALEMLPAQFRPLEALIKEKFPKASVSKIKTGDSVVVGLLARA